MEGQTAWPKHRDDRVDAGVVWRFLTLTTIPHLKCPQTFMIPSSFLVKNPDHILLVRTLAAVSPPHAQLTMCNPRHGFRGGNCVISQDDYKISNKTSLPYTRITNQTFSSNQEMTKLVGFKESVR